MKHIGNELLQKFASGFFKKSSAEFKMKTILDQMNDPLTRDRGLRTTKCPESGISGILQRNDFVVIAKPVSATTRGGRDLRGSGKKMLVPNPLENQPLTFKTSGKRGCIYSATLDDVNQRGFRSRL